MIYLELFLAFLKIGVVSFGGGYGMISLIRETVIYYGWLTEEQLLNFIAVSESTPGPIAVNMATFVGSSQAGILGALVATIGIVLPSFMIILIVAMAAKNILKYAGVKATLGGIRPAIIGLIFATFITMLLNSIFGIKTVNGSFSFDWKGLIIFSMMSIGTFIHWKIRKKSISPILLILVAAVLGVLFYGL